jgi:hypothetical protein
MHALLINLSTDAKGIFNFEAGDEAGAEFSSSGGVFGESAERTIVGECDKCGTKNGHQVNLAGRPW